MSSRPRRLAAAIAVATAGALLLAGCAGGSPASSSSAAAAADPNAQIIVGSENEPTTLDQIYGGSSGITEVFTGNVYEGLFKITDDATVEPLLAKDTKVSDDGLVYTFTLQDGVKFHSGDPVDAAAVKYSLERFIGDDSIAARKRQLSVIDHVDVVDDKTVAVTLKQPSISFTYNLGYVWIVNPNAGDLTAKEDGSGPYTLSDYRKGDSISLDAEQGLLGQGSAQRRRRLPVLRRPHSTEQRASDRRRRPRHGPVEPRQPRGLHVRRLQDHRGHLDDQGAARLQRPRGAVQRRQGAQGRVLGDRPCEAPRRDLGRPWPADRLDGPAV